MTQDALNVFISYSHKDEDLLKDLEEHLALLMREGKIRSWHDREITAGEDWQGQLDDHLNAADLILLLVSSSFIASDYCWDVEMTRALERHARGETRVVPILVRPCERKTAPFADIQCLPKNMRPVTTWSNPDSAWLDIAQGLRVTIEELTGQRWAFNNQGKHLHRYPDGESQRPSRRLKPVLPRTRLRIVHPLLRARDYQDRPEMHRVAEWWRRGGIGVCALVGIGGAGKTAITERFLRILPGVMPAEPDLHIDDSLRTPRAVFVFSFYEAPNAEALFTELSSFFKQSTYTASSPEKGTPSYAQTVAILEQIDSALLVLDGLERVQSDGARGDILGRVLDGRLNDLLERAASGYLRELSVIITSRFRLVGLESKNAPFLHSVSVEKLEPGTALMLMRIRGVSSGADEDLVRLACRYGLHALTIDLLAGYIAHFCGGDPTVIPYERSERALDKKNLDPELVALHEQETRFARVAARYQEALASRDPSALALLQRLCLFRLGINAEDLASIFTGRGKEDISGTELSLLTARQVTSKLAWLTELRLLEQKLHSRNLVYSIHPAVREGFLDGLDTETALKGHRAVRSQLSLKLTQRPGQSHPSDRRTLDLLEEIIYHTIEAGNKSSAFDLYWHRMGNFSNLGSQLGDYARGERICRALAGSPALAPGNRLEDLRATDREAFYNEWAAYLKNLGDLRSAMSCYKRSIGIAIQRGSLRNASIVYRNLAIGFLLQGRLPDASRAASGARHLAAEVMSKDRKLDAEILLSALNALQRGRVDAHFPAEALCGSAGVWYTYVLARRRMYDEAKKLAEINLRNWGEENYKDGSLLDLLLAELAVAQCRFGEAEMKERKVHDWALSRDALEQLCWGALVRARIVVIQANQAEGAPGDPSALKLARRHIESGLRIARSCGFSLYHIELNLLLAQTHLLRGRCIEAERASRLALFGGSVDERTVLDSSSDPDERGIFPPDGTRLPVLLSATHPECAYAWGEADGRRLLAEALSLKAAIRLGRIESLPTRFDNIPTEVAALINRAREELETAKRIKVNVLAIDAEDCKRVLCELDEGVLTRYPIG